MTYTYSEVAVDNETDGRRGYIEVNVQDGRFELHAEDDGDEGVDVYMNVGDVLDLIGKLTEALRSTM